MFFREISPAVIEYLPADYEFCKDKTDHHDNTKISAKRKIGAGFMFRLATLFMRDMAQYEEKGSKKWTGVSCSCRNAAISPPSEVIDCPGDQNNESDD
ncbi:MAG: hypothetical protein ABSB83_07000 [Methanomassiliicoccales archaeon]|jgi:hypothetical protein